MVFFYCKQIVFELHPMITIFILTINHMDMFAALQSSWACFSFTATPSLIWFTCHNSNQRQQFLCWKKIKKLHCEALSSLLKVIFHGCLNLTKEWNVFVSRSNDVIFDRTVSVCTGSSFLSKITFLFLFSRPWLLFFSTKVNHLERFPVRCPHTLCLDMKD